MADKIITDLASAIATRQCALFAGAGLTVNSGGCTWSGLVSHLKSTFGYDSPLRDEFEIVGDMCDKIGRKKVYEAVKDRLKNVTLDSKLTKLVSLPWFSTFTTNYDNALDLALNEHQSLNVRTIVTGREFELIGLQSEVLHVKLMGSVDISDGMPGSMVLDPGDLSLAREKRSRIFDNLASHANNLSFLFLGYSFEDKLFIEMLQKLGKELGKLENTYYALFLSPPDEEKEYLLKQYNVEIIVADINEFAEEICNEVSLRNPEDYTKKRIPLGKDIVPIDSTQIANFISLYDPVYFEDLEEYVSPHSFLLGKTHSFQPFQKGIHFEREQKNEIVKIIDERNRAGQSSIISVNGELGSGRSFTILSSVLELIVKHRALAIRISNYSMNILPTPELLELFVAQVNDSADSFGITRPELIVFWAEYPLNAAELSYFTKLSNDYKDINIFLIYENLRADTIDKKLQESLGLNHVTLNDTLNAEEQEQLKKYILRITKTYKFPEITEEDLDIIVKEEKQFLPIIYRTLDPSRRSINDIVAESYKSIEDTDVQACINICALSTAVGLDIPVAVLRKALSKLLKKEFSYVDVFELSTEKAKVFIKEVVDARTNVLLPIYHPYIANHILKIIGGDNIHNCLSSIAQTIDLRSRIEGEYAGKLLINKGVNWSESDFKRPFNNDMLESAFIEIMKRQPARPIIHHLARLYYKIDRKDVRILSLLDEALSKPDDDYILEERVENIYTTLARAKWYRDKDTLISKSRDDDEIKEIITLLLRARSYNAPNVHPYDLHARILHDLSGTKDNNDKIELLNEATAVINDGLSMCEEMSAQQSLNELRIKILSEISKDKALEIANEMLVNGDGNGYYTLALIEYHVNQNISKSLEFIEKALSAKTFSIESISFKVELLVQEQYPDYSALNALCEKLSDVQERELSWKVSYYMATVFVINSKYRKAQKYFDISHKKSPRISQRKIELFWQAKPRRREFTGKITRRLTEREGRIYSHGIKGWDEDIFFNPRSQPHKALLQSGLEVKFEIGFSPRGPVAFDVRPAKSK